MGSKLAEKMKQDWDIRGRLDPMWYIASTRRDWDRDDFFESGNEVVNKIQAGFFNSMGFDSSDKSMLDIGCGIGRLTVAFAKTFREVHGTDLSPVMLEQAAVHVSAYPNIILSQSNGIDLSQYEDAQFDFCFSHLVFMHIPKEEIILNYIREIGRVLKPNGLFRFDLSNARFAGSKRRIFDVMSSIYKRTRIRLPGVSPELLDPHSKIFQYETIDGAAPSLRRLKSVMSDAHLATKRISGTGTRIMLVEGVKAVKG